jgi:hypothetical protein
MRCVAVEAAPLPRPPSGAVASPLPSSTVRDMGASSAAGGAGAEGRGTTPGAKLPLLLSPTDLDTLMPLCIAQVTCNTNTFPVALIVACRLAHYTVTAQTMHLSLHSLHLVPCV